GVDGFELWVSGLVKLNKATGPDGKELAPRMNWTAATAATNDPDDRLTALDIASAIKLQVRGSAALDVAGVFLAYTGNVEITLANVTLNDGLGFAPTLT